MGIYNSKKRKWDISKKGHSGVFKTKNKMSIEYIQTTFSLKELDLINPLRSIFKPDDIKDFDLLLQRDLDETRIKRELIPYLKRDNKLSFFPSLLVVVLNIEKTSNGTTIKQHYPTLNEEIIDNPEDSSGESKVNSKKYGDLFSVEVLVDDENNMERWFSIFNFNRETKLLAIDGQHRLLALQAIAGKFTSERDEEKFAGYSQEKELFSELEIPVTILYVPDMYQGTGDDNEPLTSIFRQVFVDVNKNAVTVSKMRNILLDENDFNSIFTRLICSKILKEDTSNITINEIEWNKEHKVDQITEDLSISSIVFIKNFLDKWLGNISSGDKDNNKLKNNLKLNTIRIKLEDDSLSYDDMSNIQFTYNQKNIILEHFTKNYLDGLIKLITSLPLFKERHQHVLSLKKQLLNEIQNENEDAINGYKYLFGGEENKSLLNKELNTYIKNNITKELINFEKENNYDLIKTQMFQLAYFDIIIDIYAYQEEATFNEYLIEYDKIINNINFTTEWKKIFVDKFDIFKAGIGSFSKSKQNLMYEYLKLFLNKNKTIFDSSNIKFEEYEVNINSISTRFESNKIKELENLDLDDNLFDKQVEKYKKQLKEIFISHGDN